MHRGSSAHTAATKTVLYAHKHNAIDSFLASRTVLVVYLLAFTPLLCAATLVQTTLCTSETPKLQPLKIFAAAGAACMLLQDDRDGSL
jgi:hypothetical protein